MGTSGTRAKLLVVWDFDSAQGQVASSYPYHFRTTPLHEELAAVDELRELGARLATPMTFATVGFAAEDVPNPFEAHDLLRGLDADGHEIASHSWRHEWFPHLTAMQVRRSLLRSKLALEQVLGRVGAVRGLVPPFNRPMTWPRHLAFRAGDRWAVPSGPAVTVGGLLRSATGAGYEWVRVSYRPNITRWSDPLRQPHTEGGCLAVGLHHNGFADRASALLDQAVERRCALVICGHPAGLFRGGLEHRDNVVALLEKAAALRDQDRLDVTTVSGGLLDPVGTR